MSHFTVLIVGSEFGEAEVEKLLWPFWELDLKQEDMIKDPRAVFNIQIKTGDLESAFSLWQKEAEEKKYESAYDSAEEWAEEWHGYSQDSNGNWGYWGNPMAKWDWYSIGGRWTGFFIPKEGTYTELGHPGVFDNKPPKGTCDQIRKRDIDIDAMKKLRIEQSIKTWNEYEKRVAERHPCQPFAVIVENKWYERGNMGWWGIVSDKKGQCDWGSEFDAIWNEIPDDAVLTIVDCHI